MDVVRQLRQMSLFRSFDEPSLRELVDCSTVAEAADGALLIEYGHAGEYLGVLLEGRAAVRRPSAEPGGPSVELGTLGPGDYFGEMALLTGEVTTAEVAARGPCRYLRIPEAVYGRTLAANPTAVAELAKSMAARLRQRWLDPAQRHVAADAWDRARDPYRLDPGAALGDRRVLVLNCGSSSVKYCLFDGPDPERQLRGLVERIGLEGSRHRRRGPDGEHAEPAAAPDHAAALELVFATLGTDRKVDVVGHRVAHGGDRYAAAARVDDEVRGTIRELAALAPLHNPHNLAGIEAAVRRLPGAAHVAVFDTAFHRTVPSFAHEYALPHALARRLRLRRYGFHGPSHQYVALRTATWLRRPVTELKLVTCHLGSGNSACAIDHGRSIDISTGFTPLEGLIMGTRCGDIDPGLVLHLLTAQGMTAAELERILNHESGLRGVSGLTGDMREIEAAADRGDPQALLAVQMYTYRIRKYVGAYAAALGGVDALVFTAGIGENSAGVRARVCQGLDRLGIVLDEARNRAAGSDVRDVSAEGSPVRVLVVPTDEELMIAREAVRALGHDQVTAIIQARTERPIPIEVSAHHVHLSAAHVEALFGPGHALTPRSDLSQPGQFSCAETVDLVGPKGRVDRVRVLGPERKETQIEISRTEEFRLGIDAPIRASGDLKGSPGLTLVGSHGSVALTHGAICAMRHIHMSPEDALTYGLRDRDVVRIRTRGERTLIFGDVLVRISPDYRLAMHIDTDEANAAEISTGAVGFLDSIQERQGSVRETWVPTPAPPR
ncbi:MAG: acetate/propionate family kinase [Deltaproteobacteria bacterium]|nr:acetate/propionate family kinase [Deltaproteobacteria bacterium]